MKKSKSKLAPLPEVGSAGFSDQYWNVNYAQPDDMDGIFNAQDHALYLKHFFAIELTDISSVVDLGFGLGHLFTAVLENFVPYKALGIEPSLYPFEAFKQKKLNLPDSTKLSLERTDIASWCQKPYKREPRFDLGLCTSVFQYLSDEEIQKILPVLSRRIKYLYFSVPTDIEYRRLRDELDFVDSYAYWRTQKEYLDFIRPHFTIISSRILESKYFFSEDNTNFTDVLFRF